MNLARFSVNRPVAAGIISVAIFILGLYSVTKMPVSLYPEVTLPFVSVVVPMPGATPEQIEEKIVKPLEKELSGIEGVKRIIGRVRPGAASVVLGFKMSVDENEAVDNVRQKVALVKADFPADANDPIVSRIDLGATPILIYGIDSDASPEETKKRLDEGLVPELQRTEGVAGAEVIGLGEERVEIALDPRRLAASRIAPLDVFQQLSTQLAVVPWGDVRQQGSLLSVARGTLPQDPAYWNNYSLTLGDGRTVRLGEIGDASLARDEDAASVRIDGHTGLGLVVTKRAEANTLDTIKRTQKVVAELEQNSGARLFPIIDQSSYIEENAHEVWIALVIGGGFAVFVILFFLTDLKSALITATALPVSVAGTFIVMSYLGFSLNMMSLLALALAIGLLIDDAVVVREAIFSEIEAGKPAREAAVTGTDKVAAAVLATTLAVVAVFLPVAAMEGMVGQFFKEFGLTIVVAVLFSLWVAFTLDPMLSAKFGGTHKPLQGRFWDAVRQGLDRMDTAATGLASRAYRRPFMVITVAVVMLLVSGGLIASRGADFLALEDRGQLIVSLKAPAGTTREAAVATADDAYARIKDVEGLTRAFAQVGGQDPTKTEMRLIFADKNEREMGLAALNAAIAKRLEGVDAQVLVLEPPPVEGVGVEAPLSIYVYGNDTDLLFTEGQKLVDKIAALPGVATIRLDSPRPSPAVDVTIDPTTLGYQGANSRSVELTGRLALTGMEAGSVGDENLPLFVRYEKEGRTLETLFDGTYVPTSHGPVPMNELASPQTSIRPSHIDREKRSRKVVISGTLDRSRSYALVLQDIETLLEEVPAPLYAEVAGDKELFEEMTSNFALAIIGSAFFIFIILAIQFENLTRPFVILLSLPLAMVGAFLALFIAGEKLALGSLIGLILLIGLAAKNGILLVDAIGVKQKVMSIHEAVVASVRERIRPIVMTSVALIFGMLPTAIMRGGGSEFRAPMAIAIIGGVVSSTLLSIMVVPAIFGLGERIRERWTMLWKKRQPSKHEKIAKAAEVVALALALAAVGTAGSARAQSETPMADMARVGELLTAPPLETSEEGYLIKAAETAADGLTSSSRQAFLGGLKLEASREWARPGVTQTMELPLPPQLGGPHSTEIVVVPKVQNVYTVGWSLPLLNMQAIQGLDIASKAREQRAIVKALQREVAAREKARLLLEYEMARKVREVHEERVAIAKKRLKIVTVKVAAGTARRAEQTEAQASFEAAQADLGKAEAELERVAVQFALESDRKLPKNGLGLTSFPMVLEGRFAPLSLAALQSKEALREASVDVADGAYYPTVDLTFAHQRKLYGKGEPEPQNIVGLQFTWTILDGGSRRRQTTDAKRELLVARSETARYLEQLKVAFETLPARHKSAMNGLEAKKAQYRAASAAADDAAALYRTGALRLTDLRAADEAKLAAALQVHQAAIELQALAVESLVLTNQFLPYLEKLGESTGGPKTDKTSASKHRQ